MAVAQAQRFKQVELFGFSLTRTGLQPAATRKKPTQDQWQQLGDYLAWQEQASPWLIADWMAYGEAAFGEKASQVIDATGFELDTLKQYEWVGKSVPPSRRDPTLSFAHHRAVAALKPIEQRSWLSKAKKESLSVKELQRRLTDEKIIVEGGDGACWVLVQCRSVKDRQRFMKLMEREGRTVKVPGAKE